MALGFTGPLMALFGWAMVLTVNTKDDILKIAGALVLLLLMELVCGYIFFTALGWLSGYWRYVFRRHKTGLYFLRQYLALRERSERIRLIPVSAIHHLEIHIQKVKVSSDSWQKRYQIKAITQNRQPMAFAIHRSLPAWLALRRARRLAADLSIAIHDHR